MPTEEEDGVDIILERFVAWYTEAHACTECRPSYYRNVRGAGGYISSNLFPKRFTVSTALTRYV